MASFADLRPIIIIVCITGFFTLFLGGFGLGGTTPADMLGITTPTQKQFATASDMFSYIHNGTWQYLYFEPFWTSTGTLGNESVEIKLYIFHPDYPVDGRILQIDSFRTVNWGLVSYQTEFEHFIWYTNNSKTEEVSVTCGLYPFSMNVYHGIYGLTLDGWYSYYGNVSALHLYMANSRIGTNIQFAFNETLYDSPSEAWNASALYISFDEGYSETPSSANALSSVISILTWNLPGVPTWVFALVDLIVAAPIIYVAAIWILRIIGSITGGGGSG